MKDVFISYSSKDRPWVQDVLLSNLETHNFSVLIDFRDFRAGSLGIQEMQRAVEGTRHTLCVLTDHYVQSDWTTFENAMAQSMDPAAIERKVIPLMLVKCKLPLRLRMLHYRDLTTNDPQQWDLLYRDLM